MKTFDKKDVFSWANCNELRLATHGYVGNSLSDLACNIAPEGKSALCFTVENNQDNLAKVYHFAFFLPADKVKEVKEKKWRAFKDIEEFKKETGLGLLSIVRYRYINEEPRIITTTGFGVITDFSTCRDTSYITIGDTSYNLDELFNYEYLDKHCNWQPFGVLENE